jgi:hypothetical protein
MAMKTVMESNRTNPRSSTKIGHRRNTKRNQYLSNNSPVKVKMSSNTGTTQFTRRLTISRKHESLEERPLDYHNKSESI